MSRLCNLATIAATNLVLALVLGLCAAPPAFAAPHTAGDGGAPTACPKPTKQPAIAGTVRAHAERLTHSIMQNMEVSLRGEAFKSFVAQDLNYLIGYESWVKGALAGGSCASGQPTCGPVYGPALAGRVVFGEADAEDYKRRFHMQSAKSPNAALEAYAHFYRSQQTCADAANSMVVCLCSYGLVAKGIFDANKTGAFSGWTSEEQDLLAAFVAYNGKASDPAWTGLEEGTACAYARVLLETLGVPAPDENLLGEAVEHERALWSATSAPDDRDL